MNKKLLILTSLLGATFSLTGCVSTSPEDKAFKTYEDIVKIAFEVKDENELDSLMKDLKAKYDLIDFEDDIEDEDILEIYEEIFNGNDFLKDYAKALEDEKISFKSEDIRYKSLDKEDFEIISNPKIYIGDGEYLELKDMFLIFNEEPIEVQAYDKDKKEVVQTMEFVMPMLVDSKGNVKAFTVEEEESRDALEEFFLDKKGIGTYIKEVEELDESLDSLISMLEEIETSQDYNDYNEEYVKDEETTDKETTSSNSNVSKDSFIKLSGLDFEVEEEYATYENRKSGLDIFVSFLRNGGEAIDIEIPTSNISDKEFNNQLEIAMKKFGRSKDLNALKSKIDECLSEKFQNKADIKAEIEEWNGMFVVDFYESDDLDISITVYDAGQNDEIITVEFMQY